MQSNILPCIFFDDDDKTLPVWRVKYEDGEDRLYRHPFFKREVNARAKNRLEAIQKVKNFLSSGRYDRFKASKIS